MYDDEYDDDYYDDYRYVQPPAVFEGTPFFGASIEPQVVPHRWSHLPAPDDQVYLGLEVELEAGDSSITQMTSIWAEAGMGKTKEDCTIEHGAELVTYPSTYEALERRGLERVMRELEDIGCFGEEHVGLHIHISRKGFSGTTHLWRYCMAVYAMESVLQSLADRGSTYWSSWEIEEEWGWGHPAAVVIGRSHGTERSRAVNTNPPHTIENRFWRGDEKFWHVMGAAALTDALVRWTRNMTIAEARDLASLSAADYEQVETEANEHLTWGNFCAWAQQNLSVQQWSRITALAKERHVPVRIPSIA